MTIHVDELLAGDLMLYRGTGLLSKAIRFFDGAPVNHVSVYLGKGMVGEAVAQGVVRRDLETSFAHNEWVRAYRLASQPMTMQPALDCAKAYLDQGEKYAVGQLLLLALLCTVRRLQITPVLRRLLRTLLDAAATEVTDILALGKQPMICSEFGYRVHDEALPELQDAYSVVIPGMLPLPVSDALAGAMPLAVPGGRVDPASLGALFASPASDLWVDAPPLADEPQTTVAQPGLDALLEAYLDEVETGKASDMALGPPVNLGELRVAADRYVVGMHASPVGAMPEGAVADEPIDARSAAYQALFSPAADYVTPADLYNSPSFCELGVVELD